jgi:hypothetical protein
VQEQLFPAEQPPQGGNGAGEKSLNSTENTAETSTETSAQNATASPAGGGKDGDEMDGTAGAARAQDPGGTIPEEASGQIADVNSGAKGATGSQPGAGPDAAEKLAESEESQESVPTESTVPTAPSVNLLVNGPDGCFKEVEGGETVKLSEDEWRLELARIFRRESSPS